jgi:hypothetical protein
MGIANLFFGPLIARAGDPLLSPLFAVHYSAIPLLHHLISLTLLHYSATFLNIAICYSLFAIATFVKISVADCLILKSYSRETDPD